MKKQEYQSLFEEMKSKTILVIGDVMIDSYLWGKVERISPEAPVPVVAVQKRENRLGGAANVALNIRAMGAQAILLSVVGDDIKGREFAELLNEAGLENSGMVYSTKRITTTKFRVIGNNVQMLRVDEEVDHPLAKEDSVALLERFENIISEKRIDAVVFQDYDKGVISASFIDTVVKRCITAKIPVAVDPKKRNFLDYKDVTLFKPNLKELREGLKLDYFPEGENLRLAVSQLQEMNNAEIMLITLSEKGVFIRKKDKGQREEFILPAHQRTISDVSGAGDTVISLATLGLACGILARDLAYISNLAGGLVCESVGVVPVDRERLIREVMNSAEA